MNNLVIGHGEIGCAVKEVFEIEAWVDKETTNFAGGMVNAMHVSIPFSDDFVQIVNNYIWKYKPKFTIVHSTVSVGTMQKISGIRYHAPVRGRHRNLAQGIRRYEMYVSCETNEKMIEEYLDVKKIPYTIFRRFEITEAAKLLSLAQFAYNIEFARFAESVCRKHGLEYPQVVKAYTRSYNDGIVEDDPDLRKTILDPPDGKIGGHCVLPALEILCKDNYDIILNAILEANDEQNLATV